MRRRKAPGPDCAEPQPEIDVEALAKAVSRLGRLKGIAMKVGQIMSYIDVALPDELRAAMSVLQTHAQPGLVVSPGAG